jgi:octaprenyl-diphosphate synthase
MAFDEYTDRLEKIEAALQRVLPRSADAAWVQAVAGEPLPDLHAASLDDVIEPAWALLERGGKRWRPLVMVLAHELSGGTYEGIYDLSALVELPHNGSLIIDDIEDKADERRGGPAIHLLVGVDKAINSGNFLYFLPTYLLEASRLDDSLKYRVLTHYLRVMRRLHFGQGLDIRWHNDHDYLPDRGEYLRMCRYKTGALARLAAEIGFVVSGRAEIEVESFGRLWEEIGVGFQILDDVKNLVTGNPGKIRGDDVVEGKKSLPVLCHAVATQDAGAGLMAVFRQVELAHSHGEPVVELVERAISMMEASGAIDEARMIAETMLARCAESLKTGYPENATRKLLEGLMESFFQGVNR